ncbi:MAG: hypothetical protein APR63_10470 [Desulfuromonas sp. SDB]|nr:MAG: hypothetical protein APR63_10470 [Desulfuromonas sp. SDB]
MKNIIFMIMMMVLSINVLSAEEVSELWLIQGSQQFNIADQDSLVLEKLPFKINFTVDDYNAEQDRWYAARITASLNPDIFNIQPGDHTEQTQFFFPGAGLAAAGIYSSLYLNEHACHYLFYDLENPDISRAELIRVDGKTLQLGWTVDNIQGEIKQDIENFDSQFVYLIYYYDQDLDNIIDQGEFKRFTIQFVD